MIRIEFNHAPTTEAIRQAIASLENATPLFHDIGEYMVEATRKRFLLGVAPDGKRWLPKSDTTLERYRRLGYGRLIRPLIADGKKLSTEIQFFVAREGVVIGSSMIYSRVMQEGALKGAFGRDRHGRPLPWGNIPARPWLGVSRGDQQKIVEIAEEYVGRNL